MNETLTYLMINMVLPAGAGMLLTAAAPPPFALGLGIGLAILIAAGNIQRAIVSKPPWRWIYAVTTLANAATLFFFSQLSIFTLAFTAMRVFQI